MTKTTDDGDSELGENTTWNLVTQANYDRDGDHDLTTTIIAAIADHEDVSPTEITQPVLYDCVDIAALEDAFFGPKARGEKRDSIGTAEFQYGEYRVEVASSGWVSIYSSQ
ncbi:hypothetical protein SAMN05421858_1819 [Haladaptatus litoreus]|uniref:Halobacterial output domain-containing protein n=1 Tax=Haladaptatus litoreus TaxID=553468 RepID=A0A1N6Z0V2_9EURY|nr:HalOD1 output domain-containing protein [Haladaptatus litoreus]SIR20512.1 hypothetical protein SAMN05421858_1819 [Haladaptatus litoreus]